MKTRKFAIALALFSAGFLAGSVGVGLVSPARADVVKWQDIAKDPGFRSAVVEVINSCLVENGIIYCN